MNIFKSGTLKWWEVSLLKISVACIAVAIGATWPAVFAPYARALVVIGLTIGIYLAFVWFKK